MNVYRYNQYTGKHYKYNIDLVDTGHPMFDDSLHNNDITPDVVDSYTCAYCNTCFESRSKLFYHLGFMNINIDVGKQTHECMIVHENHRKQKRRRRHRDCLKKHYRRRAKKLDFDVLSDMLSHLKVV